MAASRTERVTVRITHVIETLGRGGAEQSVATLAIAQAAQHEVSVITLFRGGPHVETLRRAGVKVLELELHGWRWLARDVATLWRSVRSLKSDVLHAHLTYALVLVGLLPFMRARRVGTFHNLGVAGGREGGVKARALRELLGGVVRSRFEVVSAVSTAAASAYQRELRLQRMPLVIPNPIDVEGLRAMAPKTREAARALLGVDASTPLVVCLAKFTWEKAHDVLLEAFAKLPNTDARLVLIGDGPLRSALEQQAQSLGISSRITWTGELDASVALRWLAAASVSALSSRSEAQSLSILESMTLSVPVVACRSGGVVEVLGDGAFGALVPVDDASALAFALHDALPGDEQTQARVKRGRGVVEHEYAVDVIAERWSRVFQRPS